MSKIPLIRKKAKPNHPTRIIRRTAAPLCLFSRSLLHGSVPPQYRLTFFAHNVAQITPESLEDEAEAYKVEAERRRVVEAVSGATAQRIVETTAAAIHAVHAPYTP